MSKLKLVHLVVLITPVIFNACFQTTPPTKTISVALDACERLKNTQTNSETSGWTGLSITTCVSTEQDLIDKLGQPESISSESTQEGQYLIYNYRFLLDDNPIFWIAENKVIGIGFTRTGTYRHLQTDRVPITIDEIKELYGRPELVGWSVYGSMTRTVVWSSRGVLVEVRIDDDPNKARISNIIYFPAMDETEFANSPWSGYLLHSRPRSDVVDIGAQDPFDW